MKLSSTLFLAVLLSGLGFYYFVWEKPALKTEEMKSDRILNLADHDSFSLVEIENPSAKERMTLRRKGSDWLIVSPVFYPAENYLVEGMMQALVFSRREKHFQVPNPNSKEFGFDSSALKLTVRTEKNPQPRTLLLGKASPVAKGVYARWQGESEIFLIPDQLKSALDRTVYSLRRKKLFRVNWNRVTWMVAETGTRKFRIEKKGDKWQWVVPAIPAEVPIEKATDFIYSFQSLYIKDFLDGKNYLDKEYGLRKGEILLAAGEANGAQEKLILGNRAKGRDAFFAVRRNEDLVLLVSENNVKALLQLFEVTLQELQGEHPGKNPPDRTTDSGLAVAGPAKP